jgi:ligand-binding sensor domain-containing protein
VLDRRTGQWQTWTERDGLSNEVVNAVALDGERVWVGTRQGLNLFVPRTGRWLAWGEADGLPDEFVVSLAVGAERIWLGTDRGGAGYLDLRTGRINRLTPPSGWGPRAVETIVPDGESIWFGCWDGVRRYHPGSRRWDELGVGDGLPYPVVWSIDPDGDDVWLGTTEGLSRFSKARRAFQTFTRADGLPDDLVWGSAVGSYAAYFATGAGGVVRYDKASGNWRTVTSADGLASDEVYCVALQSRAHDDGSVGTGEELWAGTFAGASRRAETASSGESSTARRISPRIPRVRRGR